MGAVQLSWCAMDRSDKKEIEEITVLWTRAHPAVSAFISSMVPDFQDADDILQQVAVAIVQNYDRYNKERSFVSWAIGIAEYERTAPELHVERPDPEERQPKKAELVKGSRKANRTLLTVGAFCLTVVLLLCITGEIGRVWSHPEVATLKSSMNAAWAGSGPLESGTRLNSRKESLRLVQGMVDVVFDTGAAVLIEAPAEFGLRSANRMELQSGRLFADVPESAKGFTVETPYSRVVDLGTQFGVRVESDRVSDLHLFKGRASLTPETGGHAGRTVYLSRDQAKQVSTDGTVHDIPLGKEDFVRRINSKTGLAWRGEAINLADILMGGNGFNTGVQAICIDPGSGAIKVGELNALMKLAGKKGYFPVPELEYVDGVFVPDGGQGSVVISSKGHLFMDCPDTAFAYWNDITGQPLLRLNSKDKYSGRFGGRLYGTPDNPGILMHSNAGVTFDLDKIRAKVPGLALKQFSTTCGMVEGEDLGNKAVFWILVDGEKRGEFLAVSQDPGCYGNMIVHLKEQDRFLTLVTTDGGDNIDHDWSLFGLPYLAVEEL